MTKKDIVEFCKDKLFLRMIGFPDSWSEVPEADIYEPGKDVGLWGLDHATKIKEYTPSGANLYMASSAMNYPYNCSWCGKTFDHRPIMGTAKYAYEHGMQGMFCGLKCRVEFEESKERKPDGKNSANPG